MKRVALLSTKHQSRPASLPTLLPFLPGSQCPVSCECEWVGSSKDQLHSGLLENIVHISKCFFFISLKVCYSNQMIFLCNGVILCECKDIVLVLVFVRKSKDMRIEKSRERGERRNGDGERKKE